MTDRDYDALLAAQNAAQLEKLREREHHGSLRISVLEAYRLMCVEMSEVHVERNYYVAARNRPHLRLEALVRLSREFADVCNYGGMGIMECDRLIAELKEEIDAE